ncbi:hypothetical protein [Nitrosomonas sp. Nm84]|uniref:hypothetical protein n=1 Tax=Nitrosomonas sp. Nm84 TaxID=200124 RepID=UPI0021ACC085|nr:hypothetical protein [Nitrosomonas sp. Nm84]
MPQVRFDYNLLNMQDQQGNAVQAFRELLAEPDHSPWHIVVLADNLKETERLAQRLTELPEVNKVVTILDFVPTEQEEKFSLIKEMALTIGPISTATHAQMTGDNDVLAQQQKALGALATALDRFAAEHPNHSTAVTARTLQSSLTALFAQLDRGLVTMRKINCFRQWRKICSQCYHSLCRVCAPLLKPLLLAKKTCPSR